MKSKLMRMLVLLRSRQRASWDEVSNGIVLLLACVAALEAAYFGYVFAKFAPDFIELVDANAGEAMTSPAFWACTIILLAVGFQALIWGIAAAGSSAILQKRYFGV